MKTIGDILRQAREEKGLSIEVAASETNISAQYIMALEENDFAFFPGETYITGFIKSYSEFLGLSVERTLLLYRNYRIGEEPTPMEELMQKNKVVVKPLWIVLILLLVGITVVTSLLIPKVMSVQEAKRQAAIEAEEALKASSNKLWLLKTASMDEIFNLGDRLGLSVDDKNYEFIYKGINGKNLLFEEWNTTDKKLVSSFVLQLGDEKFFSISGEGQADFLIQVLDSGLRGGQSAKFRFQRLNHISNDLAQSNATANNDDYMLNSQLTVPIAQPSQSRQVVLSIKSPMRIDVTITFKGYCYFRYLLDGQEQTERYYQDGEQLQPNMRSSLRIWAANADKVRLKVGPNEVSLGKDGEVIVKDLRWVRNSSTGLWDLVLDNVN